MNGDPNYWWELVDYDLETARAMLSTGRYLYVGFMCHSVIEKSLKAVIAANGGMLPKSHNLGRLAELAGLFGQMSAEQKAVLNALLPLNLQARYPLEKASLERRFDAALCARVLAQTEELSAWIRAK